MADGHVMEGLHPEGWAFCISFFDAGQFVLAVFSHQSI